MNRWSMVAVGCLGLWTTAAPAVAPTEIKPLAPAVVEASIARGVGYLLKSQTPSGAWGSAHRTKGLNIYAPVPAAHLAFRLAVTALCVEALIETGAADRDPAAQAALVKGENWLLENLPNVRRSDADALYNVWTHAYGLSALVAMHQRAAADPARQRQIKRAMAAQIRFLERFESVNGGWGYLDLRVGAKHPATSSPSFVDATVLIALHEAQAIGVEVPERLVKRALGSLQRQRNPDNTYYYSEDFKWRPQAPINRPPGSLGRSQACNLALRLWGDRTVTTAVLSEWLDRLVTRNDWLSFGRKKPIPHESWFQVAGYFYYYGHYYAGLCADQLAPEPRRVALQRLAAILVPLQETDGSWWDYPLYDYHQPYGTAFALMTLARLQK